MTRILRRHALTLFGLGSLLLWAAWGLAGVDYDASMLASALFLAVYLLMTPFLLVAGAVYAIVGDSAAAPILWLPLGLAPYVFGDWLRSRRRSESSTPAT